MPARASLLVVADYPYGIVGHRVFAEIPWDEKLAQLYLPAFDKILLLGRLRRATVAPPGWFPVDGRFYEVLEGGDWMSALGFLRNLPALLRALRGAWDRTSVLYLKLFYVQSITAWGYNRVVSSRRRKPVATLLVGDASDALLLRDDVFPSAWT